MSIKAMQWVFDNSPYTGGGRLVHLALADKANDHNDYELWMHQAKIGAMARLSVNQVGRVLRQMVDDGYLELLEKGGGRGKAARYRLVFIPPQNGSVSDTDTPPSDDGYPTISDAKTPQTAQTPLLPTKEERKGSNATAIERHETDRVDEFWSVYPRRAVKDAARKAWAKARARAPQQTIIDGATRYRDDPNREAEFTAHPSTWLNQGRWDDDPLPARGGPGGGKPPDPLRGRHETSMDELMARATGGAQ